MKRVALLVFALALTGCARCGEAAHEEAPAATTLPPAVPLPDAAVHAAEGRPHLHPRLGGGLHGLRGRDGGHLVFGDDAGYAGDAAVAP